MSETAAAFLARLKQRKLVQRALACTAAAFASIRVLDVVAQCFGWPDQIEKLLILALAAGFCVALVLPWYHGERGAQKVDVVHALFPPCWNERDRSLGVLEDFSLDGNSTVSQLAWPPPFDTIRNDPRSRALLKKIGLPFTPAATDAT